MHVGIAFQGKQLRYPYAARLATASDVVAQQVDDHQVFRAVLGAGQQRRRQRHVLLGRLAARAGALDRPGFHLALAELEEALRRQAEDRAVGQSQVAGERRRAGLAQGAIGRPRRAAASGLEALAIVHLVAVACLDVVLDAADRLPIVGCADAPSEFSQKLEVAGRALRFLAEQGDQALAFALVQSRVEYQLAGAGLVVADQRPGIQADGGQRQAQVIAGVFADALDAPTQVVG